MGYTQVQRASSALGGGFTYGGSVSSGSATEYVVAQTIASPHEQLFGGPDNMIITNSGLPVACPLFCASDRTIPFPVDRIFVGDGLD